MQHSANRMFISARRMYLRNRVRVLVYSLICIVPACVLIRSYNAEKYSGTAVKGHEAPDTKHRRTAFKGTDASNLRTATDVSSSTTTAALTVSAAQVEEANDLSGPTETHYVVDSPKLQAAGQSELEGKPIHRHFRTEQILRDSIDTIHRQNFVKPQDEECKKRFPKCIIIGVAKCGTREVLDFLQLHPHIKAYRGGADIKGHAGYEMPYFTHAYGKGVEWFKDQMPCSYSHQITIMKNAGYFHNQGVPGRIHNLDKNMKFIILVREPVSRSISQFAHCINYCQKDCWKYRNQSFSEFVYGSSSEEPARSPMIWMSVYDEPMKNWLNYFDLNQFLIIEDIEFKRDPMTALKKVETFLGLEHYITHDMFVMNEAKGFYCIKSNLTDTGMACYGEDRGRKIKTSSIASETLTKLALYYKPKNERFFDLINKSFNW